MYPLFCAMYLLFIFFIFQTLHKFPYLFPKTYLFLYYFLWIKMFFSKENRAETILILLFGTFNVHINVFIKLFI